MKETVVLNNEVKQELIKSAQKIVEMVSYSYGATATGQSILDNYGIQTEKDGYNFLEKTFIPSNKYDKFVKQFALQTAKRVNFQVGDGTTSAIILACEFLIQAYSSELKPHAIIKDSKKFIDIFIKELKKQTKSLSSDKAKNLKVLTQLAINSCRDAKLGSIVAEAITTAEGGEVLVRHGQEHGLEVLEGVNLAILGVGSSSLSPHILTNGNTNEGAWSLLKAPKVFMTRATSQTDVPRIVELISQWDRLTRADDDNTVYPYLVGVENDGKSNSNWDIFLKDFNKMGTLAKIIPFSIDADVLGDQVSLQYDVLSAILGVPDVIQGKEGNSSAYNSLKNLEALYSTDTTNFVKLMNNLVGTAKEVGVNTNNVFVFNPDYSKEEVDALIYKLQSIMQDLMRTIERSTSTGEYLESHQLKTLEAVSRNLSFKKVFIKISSKSSIDSGYSKSLVQDAIETCRCAGNYGVVAGAGMGLYNTSKKLEKNKEYKVFTDWLQCLTKTQWKAYLGNDFNYSDEYEGKPFNFLTEKVDVSIIDNAGTYKVAVMDILANIQALYSGTITFNYNDSD
jgi:hypothetical protein